MNGLSTSTIVLIIAYAVCVFLFVVALVGALTKTNRSVERRVSVIRGRKESVFEGLDKKSKERKRKILDMANGEIKLRQNKLMNTIFNELILAGVMMRPEEYSIIWIVCAFVPSGLTALFTRQVMPSVTLAVLGAFLPIFYLRFKRKKRTNSFEAQLGDALIVVCNCLRSGLTFQQAMETIAKDMSPPISTEFSRVVSEIKFGTSTEAALDKLAKRIKSPDLLMVVSAVNVQRQTGGNLSVILNNISETIKDRLKIKGEIRSVTAQGRMSGMIIGALPIVISLMLMVISPDYMTTFFTTSTGNIMLGVAVVMEIIGFVLIRKVVTIEY